MEQEKLLRSIGRALGKLEIPYLITGGIAVVVWGRPRFTADIDVVIELLPKKANRLAGELEKIDKEIRVDRDQIYDALRRRGEFNFIHPASGLKVDFWLLKDEPFDRERMRRRIIRRIANQTLYFSSPEDLILVKLMWHKESQSTRQLEDIESILRIQKKLDMRYIKKWAASQTTLQTFRSLVQRMKKS